MYIQTLFPNLIPVWFTYHPIEGVQHQFIKIWWTRHKCPYLMNTQDLKYQQKSKSISSPDQNYFVHFDMRYPVTTASTTGTTTASTTTTTTSTLPSTSSRTTPKTTPFSENNKKMEKHVLKSGSARTSFIALKALICCLILTLSHFYDYKLWKLWLNYWILQSKCL